MPQLEGWALELYKEHFGQERYQECQTDKLCKPSKLPPAFLHQPCHDVESYFWIIVLFFLQAIPEDVVGEDGNLAMY